MGGGILFFCPFLFGFKNTECYTDPVIFFKSYDKINLISATFRDTQCAYLVDLEICMDERMTSLNSKSSARQCLPGLAVL